MDLDLTRIIRDLQKQRERIDKMLENFNLTPEEREKLTQSSERLRERLESEEQK